MTRVYLADALPKERSALRLMLLDLEMEVVGESADWPNVLANAPDTNLDMLLVDWEMLPRDLGAQALAKLRLLCPKAIVIVLFSHLDSRRQAAAFIGADAFISKGDMPERIAERLQQAAARFSASAITD